MSESIRSALDNFRNESDGFRGKRSIGFKGANEDGFYKILSVEKVGDSVNNGYKVMCLQMEPFVRTLMLAIDVVDFDNNEIHHVNISLGDVLGIE